MSTKGQLSRKQAVELVGSDIIDSLERENCEFTNRVQCDGDTLVEFSARLPAVDKDGNIVAVYAYYYHDRAAIDAIETLDQLDWSVSGYDVV